jgi:hypothetical protein
MTTITIKVTLAEWTKIFHHDTRQWKPDEFYNLFGKSDPRSKMINQNPHANFFFTIDSGMENADFPRLKKKIKSPSPSGRAGVGR